MRARLFFTIATTGIFILASPLDAQTTRYSTWGNPDTEASGAASDQRLQSFLERLNKMIDEAEKARAGDPVFLRDLRDLARGFDRPWRKQILSDSFDDGDFTKNPTWQVLAGEYWVENNWGLRNKIIQAQVQSTTQNHASGGDLAKVLLGQILNRANRNQTAPVPRHTENVIAAAVPISNAFAVEVDFSSWQPQGRFEIGVFQGNGAKSGYRVVYEVGAGLQLIRVGSRGTAVVDTSNDKPVLEDKDFHKLEWTRDASGQMRVLIDGKELLNVADRGFRDAFSGIRLSDTGGDFIVKRVSVHGV